MYVCMLYLVSQTYESSPPPTPHPFPRSACVHLKTPKEPFSIYGGEQTMHLSGPVYIAVGDPREVRDTQREYCSKPLKNSIVKRT